MSSRTRSRSPDSSNSAASLLFPDQDHYGTSQSRQVLQSANMTVEEWTGPFLSPPRGGLIGITDARRLRCGGFHFDCNTDCVLPSDAADENTTEDQGSGWGDVEESEDEERFSPERFWERQQYAKRKLVARRGRRSSVVAVIVFLSVWTGLMIVLQVATRSDPPLGWLFWFVFGTGISCTALCLATMALVATRWWMAEYP